MTDTKEYDAWGNVMSSTGSTPTPYQYVGRHGIQLDSIPRVYHSRRLSYQTITARDLTSQSTFSNWSHELSLYNTFAVQQLQYGSTAPPQFNIVIEKGRELFPYPECGGLAGAGWKFTIKGKSPCDGYLIQRVRFDGHLMRSCDYRYVEDHLVQYVEAWTTVQYAEHVIPEENGINDRFYAHIPDFSRGSVQMTGWLWLVCVAPQPADITAIRHPQFRIIDYDEIKDSWRPGRYGRDPWVVSSGALPSQALPLNFQTTDDAIVGNKPLSIFNGVSHQLNISFRCCTTWTELCDGHHVIWRENNFVTASWIP